VLSFGLREPNFWESHRLSGQNFASEAERSSTFLYILNEEVLFFESKHPQSLK